MSYYSKKINAIKEYLDKNIYPPVYDKDKWKSIYYTNCYAYSLDIPVSDIRKQIWLPGCLKEENKYYKPIYSSRDLLERVYADLEFLGFSYRDDTPEINSDEYRIEIYCFRECYGYPLTFHFTRQDANGVWTQKLGWNKKIYEMDRELESMERYNNIKVKTLVLKK